MSSSSRGMALGVLTLGVVLTTSATDRACKSHDESKAIFEASIQPSYIDFKSGRPREGEALFESVSYPGTVLTELLQNVAATLRTYPDIGVDVVGFTDDIECKEDECAALSLRRAQYIYDWLADHGVTPSQLRGPRSAGSSSPLDRTGTENGRRYNRRVQLNPFLLRHDVSSQP